MRKDLNLLRVLLVINETRQTVLAAKQLNVSQPTISVMLRKLRTQFKDQLFIREQNKLEPTPKCQILLKQIPGLLEQCEALYTDVSEWKIEDLNTEIYLMFPPSLMALLAAPLINKLTTLAPNITINCYQWGETGVHSLETKANSWGVCYLPLETNKNIFQKNIGEDRFALLMRKGHPLKSNQLADVLEYPICINTIPGYIEPSKAEMLVKKYALDKRINVRTSDMSMMLKLVSETDYIGVLTEKYAKILPDNYRSELLPPELYKDTFRRELCLLTHQRNKNDPLTEWLYTEIKNSFDS
jgi:DNA-binding transcriptional LysR family regulator